ncbi:GntR family transcriptional repressor for pyruvate dehydrogenase complex [Mycobacterium frederiksbergense]|uniref:GntR family transcriptional repressor for pyruvate dehydrogenase complex n=1 Tax=Mycolicibacterium frederiksbergense TaxID=117567 RepID=A0ABT6L605_9MYCO|nr:FadR/GntR family transcriptional regulator [Mycolicibacterium frederiksbergense]MDH6198389.1 GntR family transcriptional repressor for pyruvate dehydrogenase complex [Mycolicibacterium frederiksbergense]
MDLDLGAPSVTADIARRLRARIRAGDLGPGDRLPSERDLAKQMGVGRVSVREALRLLQAGGYVEVRRGATGGTFITALDRPYQNWLTEMRSGASEITDILDLRIGLECQAAKLAASRRTDEELAAMAAAIDEMSSSDSRVLFRNADARFHSALAQAAGNPRLASAIASARGEMFAPLDELVYTEVVESSRVCHLAVYEAVRDRDAERARLAMEAHLEQTRQELEVLIFGKDGVATGPA